MGMSDIQCKFAYDVGRLLTFAASLGIKITFGEAERPQEMQELYLQTGKSKAKRSKHQDRLAVDLNIFGKDGTYPADNDTYDLLGNYWERLSPENRWGGHFKSLVDKPHFERNE